MTTVSKLKKAVESQLLPKYSKMGFSLIGPCVLYRELSTGVFHIVGFDVSRSGGLGRVLVTTSMREVIPASKGSKFPGDGWVVLNGGPLYEKGFGDDFLERSIETDESMKKFLAKVDKALLKYAIPFFDEIGTPKKFLDSLDKETISDLKDDGSYAQVMARGRGGANK